MRSLTAMFITAAAITLSATSGCSWDSAGMKSSYGRFDYTSSVFTPYTVTLVDTTTGETLWTYEVPVGKTLSVRFLQPHDAEGTGKDTMQWDVFDANRVGSTMSNSMPCPAASSRIVKVFVRDQPEAYTQTAPAAPAPADTVQATPTTPSTPSSPAAPSEIVLPDAKQPAPSATPPEAPKAPGAPKAPEEPKAPPVDLPQ